MRKFSFAGIFAASAIAVIACATPAQAQATRTWISGVGDDANPCSRTAPCKTFAGAISKTATEGEINCLDPGGFGALTITKSVSILCGGVSNGGVLVGGTNGFVVNAPAGSRVVLDGLDFEGIGSGLNGVSMVGAGFLTIRNCSIRDFTQFGVNVAGPTGNPAPRVLIQNSYITNNFMGGIQVQGASGATNNAEVLNTLIDTNTTGSPATGVGITVIGASTLVLSASTVTGHATGLVTSGGGSIVSYGNNVIRNGGAPTSTLPLQ